MTGIDSRSPKRHAIAVLAALALLLILAAAGCQLDRAGIALRPNPAGLTVDPELACPGDNVGLRWNLTGLPRSGDNCRSCTVSSTCAEGFSCVDGLCCRTMALAGGSTCNVAGRCLPSTVNMTLGTSDPAIAVPELPRPLPLRGGISLPVTSSIDVTAAGSFALPLEGISDRAHVRVNLSPDDPLPLRFPFVCEGSRFAWTLHDFTALGPSTSDALRIETVRNTTRLAIMVTGGEPSRGPVRIEAFGETTAFGGLAPRGRWFAFIPADALAGLPPPSCSPTGVMNRLPDIGIDMRLVCRKR